ncbi:MAG: 3-keto-disaccharide hydrolase [Limnochordia bacterium]|jgi:hypothetical protein
MCNPPKNAVILFNGKDLSNWHQRNGQPATWTVEEGVMTVVKGDILSEETFRDAFIHLEFRVPDMPEASGQAKGNSGVYVQGRYEIQVLDSYGINIPGKGDCGAIYNQFAPLVNACKPALEWQSYDIIFRAARVNDEGEVVENARMTVLQNGQVIQNNVILMGPTGGAIDHNVGEPGPLLLQDHRDKVQYRNVWMVHLPPEGSDTYEPR